MASVRRETRGRASAVFPFPNWMPQKEDNPVRFLDAFDDEMSVASLGFRYTEPGVTGRPPSHPGDLLKLYLYGSLLGEPEESKGTRISPTDPDARHVHKRVVGCNVQTSVDAIHKLIVEHPFGTMKRAMNPG